MKTRWIALFTAVLASCSPSSNDETSLGGGVNGSEQPFYRIDRNASGPLTMQELQVNIPKELDALYTPRMRNCFFERIEELSASAGDPETLDPASVAYLPKDGSWEELSAFHKRNILAQAIVSRAGALC